MRDNWSVVTSLPAVGSPATRLALRTYDAARPDTVRRRRPRQNGDADVADRHAHVDVADRVALLALVIAAAEVISDVLPDDPLIWVVTPLRLVLGVGLLALCVATLTRAVGYAASPPTPLRFTVTGLDVAVVLLLAASALASRGHPDSWSLWRGLVTAVAAYYLARGVVSRHPRVWQAIGLLALLGVGTAALVALGQAANDIPTGFCRGSITGSADSCRDGAMIRVTGTFANPNILAGFLLLLVPYATTAAGALQDAAARLVVWSVVVAGCLALLLTASRGGLAGALVGAAALVVLRRPTPLRLAVSAVVAGGSVLAESLVIIFGARFGVRGDVWSAAMDLASHHPLGVGPGRAGDLIVAAVPDRGQFAHAHNLWLNWLVEAGILGFLAVTAITVLIAARVVRAALQGSMLAAVAGSSLTGFATLSLVDHPANTSRILLLLGLLLGVTAAVCPARSHSSEPPAPRGQVIHDPEPTPALVDTGSGAGYAARHAAAHGSPTVPGRRRSTASASAASASTASASSAAVHPRGQNARGLTR